MKEDIRVLVMDDSKTLRMTLDRFLQGRYSLKAAIDGREGIELYKSFKPDVVLLDINMPHVDGFGVIDYIRNTAKDPDCFILMLTAEDDNALKPKALNLGANDFLFKPFDRTELLARVGVAERQVRLARERAAYMERIEREIETVAALQSKLLPVRSPYFRGAQISSLYRPSGQASGDYYDYFPVGDRVLRAVVADVSGHGARAAFIMAIVRTLMRATATAFTDLPNTFAQINHHLTEIIGQEEDFVTMLAADIDFASHTLKYINAGHCPGMVVPEGGEAARLDPQSTVMGFFDMEFSQTETVFDTGSQLFLYTDGFYEWELKPGNFLNQDRFWKLAANAIGKKKPFLESLMSQLDALAAGTPGFRDDLTALWIKAEGDDG